MFRCEGGDAARKELHCSTIWNLVSSWDTQWSHLVYHDCHYRSQYCCMMSDFGVQFEIYIFTIKLWRTQNNLCMLFLERPPNTPQDCKFFIIVINYFLIQYLKSHTHCFEKFGFYMDFEVNQCLFEQTLAVNGIAITGMLLKFFFEPYCRTQKSLLFWYCTEKIAYIIRSTDFCLLRS